jgi:hypothetical protein
MRILVYRTGRLGDFIVSVPALQLIRRSYPAAKIILLTCASTRRKALEKTRAYVPENARLPWLNFVHPGLVDEVIDFTWKQGFGGLVGLRRKVAGTFERIYILSFAREPKFNRLKKLLFLRLLGANGDTFGWRGAKIFGEDLHQVDAAVAAVAQDPDIHWDRLYVFDLRLTDARVEWARLEWASHSFNGRPIVAIFAGGTYPHKRWPLESFVSLCNRLKGESACGFLFIGSLAERELGDAIAEHVDTVFWNSCGELDLEQLGAALRQCAMFLGNDSGPGHLAAALGVPCVSLMSGVHVKRTWEPWGEANIALRHVVKCSPCLSENFCPIGTMECIRGIGVDEALAACLGFLNSRTNEAQ